jgi:hypothetical protein
MVHGVRLQFHVQPTGDSTTVLENGMGLNFNLGYTNSLNVWWVFDWTSFMRGLNYNNPVIDATRQCLGGKL